MSGPDRSILPQALGWVAEGRDVALATVVQTWGSAPQPVGSQLVIDSDGNFIGSVSGGCVEGSVIAEAVEAMARGQPKTLEFGVEDDTAWRVGLACGGTIRIFVEPLNGARSDAASAETFQQLSRDIEARRSVALIANLATGAQSIVYADAPLPPALAGVVDEAFRRDKSTTVESDAGELFVNVFNPPIRLLVIGAVHVAQHLVPMARALGFDVSIVDPRTAFATEERFAGVAMSHDWPDEALPKIGLDRRTAVLTLTHDPKLDDPALIQALPSAAFYVGALGSSRTHAKRIARLEAAGVPADAIARLHAPIGLDIGAQGPAEIALSIVAQITAVLRGKADKK